MGSFVLRKWGENRSERFEVPCRQALMPLAGGSASLPFSGRAYAGIFFFAVPMQKYKKILVVKKIVLSLHPLSREANSIEGLNVGLLKRMAR